jgi:hypothetical protein
MNTLKTVFGKLFKEETQLASHEVELALRDDIIASFQKYLGQRDVAKKVLNKAENAIIEAYNNYSAIAAFGNATLQDMEALKAKAKEIGLGLDPQMESVEKKVKSEIKGYVNNAKAIGDLAKTMSNYKTSL